MTRSPSERDDSAIEIVGDVVRVLLELSASANQSALVQLDELVAERLRSRNHDGVDGVDRLRAALDRSAAGDAKHSNHLNQSGLGLRRGSRCARKHRPCCLLCVDNVGLAAASAVARLGLLTSTTRITLAFSRRASGAPKLPRSLNPNGGDLA